MTEDRHRILDNMVHIGKGFEVKLTEELPIVYYYNKPDEQNAVATIGDIPVWQSKMYRSITGDLSQIPTGMSKFQYLDKNKNKVQSEVINQILKDKNNMKTFVLTTRPRVEAATDYYGMYLKGMWVDKKGLKNLQAPEEFEDPFPAS